MSSSAAVAGQARRMCFCSRSVSSRVEQRTLRGGPVIPSRPTNTEEVASRFRSVLRSLVGAAPPRAMRPAWYPPAMTRGASRRLVESDLDGAAEHTARVTIDQHHAQGVTVYGPHAYERPAFFERARLVTRRWYRGPPSDWISVLASLAGADFYLASACHAGRESAWTRLREDFRGRLRTVALRRGARPAEASEWADDTLADLSLPAILESDQRRIGSYSGRGALYAYLATLVLRRGADEVTSAARRRKRLHRKGASGIVRTSHDDDGLDTTVGRETASRVRQALRRGMDSCTPREHLALVLKFRDGLPQTEIAALLRVGTPRVSRLVSQALEKVGTALRRDLKDEPSGTEGAWMLVCDAVRRELGLRSVEGEG